jgi:hypothetical protein
MLYRLSSSIADTRAQRASMPGLMRQAFNFTALRHQQLQLFRNARIQMRLDPGVAFRTNDPHFSINVPSGNRSA